MSDHINELDFAFVVDTTGSMSGLIASAKGMMTRIIKELSQNSGIDLQFGLVEYEDHPPQGKVVAKAYEFTADLKKAQSNINLLQTRDGGDTPESVLDGLKAACKDLKWRHHARRIAILVGDAPPHGVGCAGDKWPSGCPCGETIESISALIEETGVTLYSVSLQSIAKNSFDQLARLTGGEGVLSTNPMEQIKKVLDREFSNVDFDREVFRLYKEENSIETISVQLGVGPFKINEAINRLNQRKLLDE